MFQPEWVIRNGLDFVRRFQDPAFAPCIDEAVLGGRPGNKRQRNFENDGVDILACLTIYAAVHEAEVTVFIFAELIAVPGQGPGGRFFFTP